MWNSVLWVVALSIATVLCLVCPGARGEDSSGVGTMFANPPREYSSAPLWVWNDMLTEDQIRGTLRDLAGQGVVQAFVHPRPGLMTPYLSDDWFRLWKAALDEAEKLDMNIWIYDENSYPSGFAGGHVPELMPESRGIGLEIRKVKTPGVINDDVLAVFQLEKKGRAPFKDVTKQARKGKRLPDGEYVVAVKRKSSPSSWFGGRWYVDLLRPGVTEKFLDVTLEAYRRELGDQFGKRLPGVFTDEPRLSPAKGMHWTEDLPQVFEKRWGYSLLENLPSLAFETGDWKQVRHNYFQTLLDLFIERWGKPYFDYCAKNNLEFTGHYWEHEWPDTGLVPDNMAMAAWQQRPGIDMLFNQEFSDSPHAQVGNVRAGLEVASIANQLGPRRTLCEAYGGSGWDMRFEDMKRNGDWLCVLGINMLDEHLSHITLRGARKGDYPPTFSYHTSWWSEYHVITSYFKRVSLVLSRGEQINEALLIEPTTSVWMYQSTGGDRKERIGNEFQKLVTTLATSQIEFDLGCENVMADHGSVEGAALKVGRRSYTAVIVPPGTENLNAKTVALIEQYLKNGGAVLACGECAPTLMDGQESPRVVELVKSPNWTRVTDAEAIKRLSQRADGFAVRRAEGDAGILFHHRRRYDDGEFVFLSNASPTNASAGTVAAAAAGVTQWDLEAGTMKPYPFEKTSGGVEVRFDLPPAGSLMLFLSKSPVESTPAPLQEAKAVKPAGALDVQRDAPNVLTLDYVDITCAGETKTAVHFYQATTMAFEKHGMKGDPWDHAVQYKDEIISRTFAPDSGFEVTYRFTIAETVPPALAMVIERPDLYSVTCNGTPVAAKPGDWWLDRAFGKIDIAAVARVGENAITLKASPFTVFHEIQPIYVIGTFALEASDKGFTIMPDRPLQLGPWNAQGLAMYGHSATYTQTFKVAKPAGRFTVSMPAWLGSVAKVTVNGKDAGAIFHQPFECDVTEYIAPGKNVVAVTVIGTLKNTMGPHHGNPKLGFAAPDLFRKGPETGPPPGNQYHTVGYGLFEPFVLSNR